MKLIDEYLNLKKEYKDTLILLKSGAFYTTFDDDAIMLNYLFSYQIVSNKIGFPLSNLDKVINSLKMHEINFIVYDNDILDSYNSQDNSYLEYYSLSQKYYYDMTLNNALLDRISYLIKNKDNYLKIKAFIDEF